MSRTIHLKSPEGKVVSTSGEKSAQALKSQGWTETEAPEKKLKKSSKKGYYYSDSAFRGY